MLFEPLEKFMERWKEETERRYCMFEATARYPLKFWQGYLNASLLSLEFRLRRGVRDAIDQRALEREAQMIEYVLQRRRETNEELGKENL